MAACIKQQCGLDNLAGIILPVVSMYRNLPILSCIRVSHTDADRVYCKMPKMV